MIEDEGPVKRNEEALPSYMDSQRPDAERLLSLSRLGGQVSSVEVKGLILLLERPEEEISLRKNALAGLLMQEVHASSLPTLLGRMAMESEESPEWREFCIRHLPLLHDQTNPPSAELIDSLFAQVVNESGIIPAAALKALEEMSALAPSVEKRLATLPASGVSSGSEEPSHVN